MQEPQLVLGIGELLWDMLPEGARLGGAPANFTVMSGRLGDHAVILSRIGRDELGRRAVEILDPLSSDESFLQVDYLHETGKVTVSLKDGGKFPCTKRSPRTGYLQSPKRTIGNHFRVTLPECIRHIFAFWALRSLFIQFFCIGGNFALAASPIFRR